MVAELRVTLLSETNLVFDDEVQPDERGFYPLRWTTERWLEQFNNNEATSADVLTEFAGRVCYRSFDRPNPATRSNRDYLRHILEVGHESVLAHAHVAFHVEGVSRALTHELVRHRFLAFSQESQRFVDASDVDVVVPPLLDDNPATADLRERLLREFYLARHAYEEIADALIKRGVPRKHAREAARAVLPNCAETRLVVSGNLRAWRDFIKLRREPSADAEIRRFALAVAGELARIAPNAFQDLVTILPAEQFDELVKDDDAN